MADVSIIDFGDGNGNRNVKDKNAARSSAIAPVEDGSTSSAAYSVGDYICRNGQLYKVTTDIAIGDIIGNNIQLTKVVDEMGSGGGGGSTVSITPAYQSGTKLADYSINGTPGAIYAPDASSAKHRYTITASGWSNSVDANGYYTYDVTLVNQSFVVPTPVNVYLSGVDDDTFATDTETTQYSYLKGVKLISSTLVRLYAKTKPTSTFYIYISSDGGSGGGAYTFIGSAVSKKSDFTVHTDPQYYNSDKTITSLFNSIINGSYSEVNIIVRVRNLNSIYWTSFIVTTGTYAINAIAEIKNTNIQLFLPMPAQTANFTHFIIRLDATLNTVVANARVTENFYNAMDTDTEIAFLFYVK